MYLDNRLGTVWVIRKQNGGDHGHLISFALTPRTGYLVGVTSSSRLCKRTPGRRGLLWVAGCTSPAPDGAGALSGSLFLWCDCTIGNLAICHSTDFVASEMLFGKPVSLHYCLGFVFGPTHKSAVSFGEDLILVHLTLLIRVRATKRLSRSIAADVSPRCLPVLA